MVKFPYQLSYNFSEVEIRRGDSWKTIAAELSETRAPLAVQAINLYANGGTPNDGYQGKYNGNTFWYENTLAAYRYAFKEEFVRQRIWYLYTTYLILPVNGGILDILGIKTFLEEGGPGAEATKE